MKRAFLLVFLPLALFALEPVNLIKDAGFEKDSDVWVLYSKADGGQDSTVINRHDPDSAWDGGYSGSVDTRTRPAQGLPNYYLAVGYMCQTFSFTKKLQDLDSLVFAFMAVFPGENDKLTALAYGVKHHFSNSSNETIDAWYSWFAPGLTPGTDTPNWKIFPYSLADEGIWEIFAHDIYQDFVEIKGLSPDIELDSIRFYGGGENDNGLWRGQKVFFDGIRLTGYADYDVGVKEILSGDSLRQGTPYVPEALIKNFGREPADSFLVIAEIWDTFGLAYVDTLPWSLAGDTEDTVTFKEFDSFTRNYILTIRTVAEPDECDEDDELSKFLTYVGITEAPHPDAITLEVRSLTAPLCVAYSLPYAETGTLTLYDATGRRIERVNVRGSGKADFTSALPSGVYIVRLETGQSSIARKAVVLR